MAVVDIVGVPCRRGLPCCPDAQLFECTADLASSVIHCAISMANLTQTESLSCFCSIVAFILAFIGLSTLL